MQRDHALDGLRGLAALAVVFSHVASLRWVPFVDDSAAPDTITYLLWHLGAPAVDLFFVLSGYVVSTSFMRHRTAYGPFVLSRMVRLLPIAWAGLAAGLALRFYVTSIPDGMSTSLAELHRPMASSDVIGFSTMLFPMPKTALLNPPLWSMFVEMQASLAMPLLAAVAFRKPIALVICGVIAVVAAATITTNVYPLLFSGFIIGAAYAGLEDRVPRAPQPGVVLIASLAILFMRTWLGTDDDILRPVCALAALGVIIAVRDGAAQRFLELPAIQWLGAISYPLYATHFPILAAAGLAGATTIGITASALAAIPVAMGVAAILWVALDRPSIGLSKAVKA